MTMIVVMTGEGWYDVMGDLSQGKGISFNCIEDPSYQDYVDNGYKTIGCGTPTASVFFLLYVFIVTLILVNLFIAVTL
jgi:hypothetical protein